MLPPVESYSEPPKDQENCELTTCKHCSRECWISEKKRAITNFHEGEHMFLGCYDCIQKKVQVDSEFRKLLIEAYLLDVTPI